MEDQVLRESVDAVGLLEALGSLEDVLHGMNNSVSIGCHAEAACSKTPHRDMGPVILLKNGEERDLEAVAMSDIDTILMKHTGATNLRDDVSALRVLEKRCRRQIQRH